MSHRILCCSPVSESHRQWFVYDEQFPHYGRPMCIGLLTAVYGSLSASHACGGGLFLALFLIGGSAGVSSVR